LFAFLAALAALAPAAALAQPAPAASSSEPAAQPAPPVVMMQNTSNGSSPATAPPTAGTPAGSAPSSAPAALPLSGHNESPLSYGGPSPVSTGTKSGAGDWKFDFHGYFRAPLMLGLGKRDNPAPGQSSDTIHRPVVPDDQYLSWAYTGHQAHDWAEVFLSYGNNYVKGVVGLLGFGFTDAAWQNAQAQYGIGQAYVLVDHDLGYQNVRLQAKVGSFWGKYGMAGKYDAGKYDTFVFGRTHVMGGTVRLEIDLGKTTLWAEEGLGAKQPNPSIYNNARFTMLQHLHAGLSYNKFIDVSLHHLHSWAQEEDRDGATLKDAPDGQLGVVGGDVRLRGNMYGELYAGYSHIYAKSANVVAPAIEVLHANGGGEFSLGVTSNYLDGPTKSSHGNGAVDSLSLQYDFSVANLLENLRKPDSHFWGEGRDLTISLFTMMNWVKSDDPDANGTMKLKYGTDIVASLLPWLAIGARFDRVQPNSKVPEQSFAVLSPRIVFRTQWITHEEITVQYSRYFYNQRECDDPTKPTLCVQPPSAPVLPDGFGALTTNQDPGTRGSGATRPDLNVFKLQASMWW
jgi:hypothetical protein